MNVRPVRVDQINHRCHGTITLVDDCSPVGGGPTTGLVLVDVDRRSRSGSGSHHGFARTRNVSIRCGLSIE